MLTTPGLGLIFWMTIAFLLLVVLLGKFAWKPIVNSINKRNESIAMALQAAEEAKKDMLKLQANNEQLIAEAKVERDALVREAHKLKENIIEQAREKATEEATNIIKTARENIHFEKMAAINELKNQIATISIDIAEKLLKKELENKEEQKQLTDKLLKEIKIN